MKEPKQTRRELVLAAAKQTVREQNLDFFHDSKNVAWVSIPVNNHLETYKVQSPEFKTRVRYFVYKVFNDTDPKTVNTWINYFDTVAICEGRKIETHLRVAVQDDILYIDLCNDAWQVVEVSADGWAVRDHSPVKFQRMPDMQPLPIPQQGKNLSEFAKFFNVPPKDEVLLLAWLTFSAGCVDVPYPLLVLTGEQGSGKTSISTIVQDLIDPNAVKLLMEPHSQKDLAIAAGRARLLVYDNLSKLTTKMSDTLCRISTGGGFRTRTLYTTADETCFQFKLPCLINGIEELASRADLLDRSILITLKYLENPDHTFETRFEATKPEMFGAMLDTIVAGRRAIDSVVIPTQRQCGYRPPRMIAFARWGVAIESSLGFPPGTFLAAYYANIEEAKGMVIDNSSVALLIPHFLHEARPTWEGPAGKLLHDLREFIALSGTKLGPPSEFIELLKHPEFPKTANKLSGELRRLQPALRKLGISFEVLKPTNRGRSLRLTRMPSVMRYGQHTETKAFNHDATTVQ